MQSAAASVCFSCPQEAKEQGVTDCRVWGSGFVALTGRFRLVAVNNVDDPHPRLLSDMGICGTRRMQLLAM